MGRKKRSRAQVSVDHDAERKRQNRRTNLELLAQDFETTDGHPRWYQELAEQMKQREQNMPEHAARVGIPNGADFDSALSDFGDADGPVVDEQDGRETLRDRIERDLEDQTDCSDRDWRLRLYRDWRSARKHDLKPEGLKSLIATRALPGWFWKFRYSCGDSNTLIWTQFDDDISELDERCTCADKGYIVGRSFCDAHTFLTPFEDESDDEDKAWLDSHCQCQDRTQELCDSHKPLVNVESLPDWKKELFKTRHHQREQRKVQIRQGLPAWWHTLIRSGDQHGCHEFEELKSHRGEKDLFEDSISEIEEGCSCVPAPKNPELNDDCSLHNQERAKIESHQRLPALFLEFWTKREQAKLSYAVRSPLIKQYKLKLAVAAERYKKAKRNDPSEYPWFERVKAAVIERELADRRQRPKNEYNNPDITKEELGDGRWIGHPLYSDFYADLSDDALSDLENPEYDDTWKELCACPSEYSDCVCGAQDDYGWGDTEYLRPDREREEIQAEFNKTGDIDHRRLRKWRVTRKRCKDSSRNVIKRRQEEIKKQEEQRKKLIAEREQRLKDIPGIVAQHTLREEETAVHHVALSDSIRNGEKGPSLTVPEQRRGYNLYSSAFAALPSATPAAVDGSLLTVNISRTSPRPKKRPVLLMLWLCNSITHVQCSLPKRAAPKGRTLQFGKFAEWEDSDSEAANVEESNSESDEESDTVSEDEKTPIKVTFINDDYVRLKMPVEFLRKNGALSGMSATDHTASSEASTTLPEFFTFVGINRKHPAEEKRQREKEAALKEKQRKLRGPSPKDNWFNNNHAMGAYGGCW